MKEITLNNKKYKLILINKYDDIMFDNIEGRIISFHKGYKKIGRISDILKDEDICKGLMIKDNWSKPYSHLWTKHNADKEKECWWVSTATDSFLSYLQSIDLDLTKEYLLIKKN